MAGMKETLNQIIRDGLDKGLVQNHTENERIETNKIIVQGNELINFGSCSYLGLELNEKLKEGVMNAVSNYGTQFSSSRTYLSLGLYEELEGMLRGMFQKPVIVTASTTLGHLATLPVVVGDNDAVILDLQVHSSIQMNVQQLKAKKIPVFVIKHNCMDSLERKIWELRNSYDKIWYFADGVYSMYGDYAPFEKLEELLDKYPKFHLYIDDAHGMSWTGENGVGVVRSHMKHHDKMVLAVSLNKSFAAAGGCIILPNKKMEEDVRNCGSTYIFCGPIQPPMLGAAIASAKLHMSDEIIGFQRKLRELIDYTNQRLDELSLPQFKRTDSPLFFIPTGLPRIISRIIQKMMQDGFYLNPASFPAVPIKKGGVRFMVNGHMTKQEINQMLTTLQRHYIETLIDEGSSCAAVAKEFKIPKFSISVEKEEASPMEDALSIEFVRSIREIEPDEWSLFFANNGNLNYENLELLERIFSTHRRKENNWDFYYFTVRDQSGETILKTFYTVAYVKDDMFSPEHVSQKVEEHRLVDPYYLTSLNVVSGSLITKGRQIYLNRANPHWKQAMKMLIDQMQQTLEEVGATKLMLRDFIGKQDEELEKELLDQGLISHRLLNNCVVPDVTWNTREDFLAQLGQKYRYNVRKEILNYEHMFLTETDKPKTEREIRKCFELYREVHANARKINAFPLPFDFFEAMCKSADYDIIRLYLKPEFSGDPSADHPVLVGVMYSCVNDRTYNALIVGLDYRYVRTHNSYKQILYQTLLRSREVNCKTLDLAYTAELEKKKLGAQLQEVYAYVQATEHYNFGTVLINGCLWKQR